ncbi:MAG: hypothetical protein ACM31C_34425 [Acidobacteriota bacterium]
MRAERAVVRAAIAVIVGILLSGPIALVAVAVVHPQPSWEDAARFASEFHPVQLMPYLGGFVLVGGCVALVASLHALVPREQRARANLALVMTGVFGALIGLNYILQTTFVPSLVAPYADDHATWIESLAMANPRSLAWALELWGYAALGVATWAVAAAFGASRLERATAALFGANAVISVAGALATMAWPGWEMTLAGGLAFSGWNALMIVMASLAIACMRRRAT